MTKRLLLPVLYFLSLTVQGQLIERPVTHQSKPGKTLQRPAENPDRTLTLPFWDDFSTANGEPSPLLWKYGVHVAISGTVGQNAPSLNVALFNGIDSAGLPYNIDDNAVNPVDSLVSQKIDLTQVPVNRQNSIFMSFFWQANGLGETPDNDDMLSLFFMDREGNWVQQDINDEQIREASLVGGPDILRFDPNDPTRQIFTQKILQVDESFIHEDFRFMFRSFGSQQGPFDSWLIDYVYLNYARSANDLVYEDRAFATGNRLTFGGYHSIPSEHLFNNRATLSSEVVMEINNLDDELQPLNYWVELYDQRTGDLLVQVNDESEVIPTLLANERKDIFSNSITPDSFISSTDTLEILVRSYLETDDELVPNAIDFYDFRANDTIYNSLKFERYYAYDDGTAEFAAGLNVDGGRLVVKYGILSLDTLTHVDINFPVLFPDSNREIMQVLVLSDLTDNDDGLLLEQDFAILPRDSSNQFTRIALKEQFILEDSIYIGIQQSTSDFVPIGLDKNNDNGNKIFLNLGETWQRNSGVKGSLMIRPVFGEPFAPTNVEEQTPTALTVYPNPTDDMLNLDVRFGQYQIADLSGKIVLSGNAAPGEQQIDVRDLESGIYVLRVQVGTEILTRKFVRR